MPRSRWSLVCLLTAAFAAASVVAADAPRAKVPAAAAKLGVDLIFTDDFESGQADRWEPTDAQAWKILELDGKHVYSQFQESDFKPPVRSPFNRSLIKDLNVGSFVFDVKLQSTHPDYGHRDMCLFFGYQDDSHLYYVHLGKKMDPHANNIFIVNGDPRKSISTKTTDGTNWDDEWHEARVVRDAKEGTIAVYFDDMDEPVMTAKDSTFTWGRVGVGTFDDTGNFDNVQLFGEVVEPPK